MHQNVCFYQKWTAETQITISSFQFFSLIFSKIPLFLPFSPSPFFPPSYRLLFPSFSLSGGPSVCIILLQSRCSISICGDSQSRWHFSRIQPLGLRQPITMALLQNSAPQTSTANHDGTSPEFSPLDFDSQSRWDFSRIPPAGLRQPITMHFQPAGLQVTLTTEGKYIANIIVFCQLSSSVGVKYALYRDLSFTAK